jgi:hypothetical protein
MSARSSSESRPGQPDPEDCAGPADVGQVYHDAESDIWYECVFEPRRGVYTWTILPPVE